MQTILNNGKTVRWNSFEENGFEKALEKEKAMSDKDWKAYQDEIKNGRVFGVWFFGTILTVCCIYTAYQTVNQLLG